MTKKPDKRTHRIRVDLVEAARKKKGWSYTTLAARTGVHLTTLNRWLNDGQAMMDNIGLLAEALGTDATKLLADEAADEPQKKISVTITVEGDERFLPPHLQRALLRVLQFVAGLHESIELEGVSAGSINLHVLMTPEDARRLVAAMDDIRREKEAWTIENHRARCQPMYAAFGAEAQHIPPDQRLSNEDIFWGYQHVLQITKVYVPATWGNKELLWQAKPPQDDMQKTDAGA